MKNNKSAPVEIWVPTGTSEEDVQAILNQYKDSERLIVIFRSGEQNLLDLTKALLANNI